MDILNTDQKPWKKIKEIYFEAFPKAERKPFFTIRHSVKSGRLILLTAMESNELKGFIMAVPYKDTVMVDYLAVSKKTRSNGTGSKLLQEVIHLFPGKKTVLLIEELDDSASNREQRIARRNFYFKNGFSSSNIHVTGRNGHMELLNFGGKISTQEYLDLQRYALGWLMFKMSKIKPII